MRYATWGVGLTVVLSLVSPACAAFLQPLYGSARTSNIVYGTGLVDDGAASTNLLLDFYRPTNIGTPVPAVSPGLVLIHGGSFQFGSKNDMAALSQAYASYGYRVASINYRLEGDNPPVDSITAAVQDARKAMQWMYDHAAENNVDRNYIGIGGISAGAITSLFVAYNAPANAVRPALVLDFLGSMFGLEFLIGPGEPPAFVVHGTADTVVPFSGAQAAVNRMNTVGLYNEFYVQEGLGHTVDFARVYDGKTLFQHNIAFMSKFLVPEPPSIILMLLGIGLCQKGVRNLLQKRSLTPF